MSSLQTVLGSSSTTTSIKINAKDVPNMCRACLKCEKEMKNIYEKGYKNVQFVNMFYSCAAITITSGDGLPTSICKLCEEKLLTVVDFKEQCTSANDALQKYLLDRQKAQEKQDQYDERTQTKMSFDSDDDDDDEDEDEEEGTNRKKQKTRLTQYSVDVVNEALLKSRPVGDMKRECKHCGFIASNIRGLRVHASHVHKQIKTNWCSACSDFVENMDDHKNCQQHVCEFCEKVFTSRGHLTEHLRSHTGVRPYNCKECSKCFISARHLKVHCRIHTGEKPYSCQVCDRKFSQKRAAQNHMKTHREVKCELEPVKAETCGICNEEVNNLSKHMNIHKTMMEEAVASKLCTMCGKQFKSSSKLRLHMRVHTGETPYRCKYCDKRFATRGQMVVHIRIHTGEKPHICHICGKSFAQPSVLNTHMRLHTGRPEVCTICDQRFCRPAELRLHMRKHTGEKPYMCTECGHAFVQRSHLMEHLKTHSGERPFQCTDCNRAFKQNSTLKSHMQIHTGYKPYQCTQCPYACRQAYSLTQHMKQHKVDAVPMVRTHTCYMCPKSFTSVAMLNSHTLAAHPPTADTVFISVESVE